MSAHQLPNWPEASIGGKGFMIMEILPPKQEVGRSSRPGRTIESTAVSNAAYRDTPQNSHNPVGFAQLWPNRAVAPRSLR